MTTCCGLDFLLPSQFVCLLCILIWLLNVDLTMIYDTQFVVYEDVYLHNKAILSELLSSILITLHCLPSTNVFTSTDILYKNLIKWI